MSRAPRRLGRVIEERLRREARGDQIRVVMGIALPRPQHVELVRPRLDRQIQPRLIELFVRRHGVGIDGREAPAEIIEAPHRFVDAPARQIVEMIVMRMHAIERGERGVRLVKPGEVVRDEMLQRLG